MSEKALYKYLSGFISPERKALFEKVSAQRTDHICVALEDIYQSQNASAVLRTADLTGVQKVNVIEMRNEYTLNPDVVLGSNKWLDINYFDSSKGCIEKLKAEGYTILATSPHSDSFSPFDIPIDRPLALCFGTEKDGLTDQIMDKADMHLKIPMYGFTESYNISVSAAICLQIITERLRVSEIEWKLSETRRQDLLLKWVKLTLKKWEEHQETFLKTHKSL